MDLEKLLIISKQGSSITHYTGIMMLALNGLRKDELFALTIKDVDLENKTIIIYETRDYHGTRDTKTINSKRVIPITDESFSD